MTEIKPAEEHLSDPYVLQLIEAIARRDDEIDRLRAGLQDMSEADPTAWWAKWAVEILADARHASLEKDDE